MPVDYRDYVTDDDLRSLIERARLEDVGPQGRDVTSELLIEADRQGEAVIRSREHGRVVGAELLPMIAAVYDASVQVEPLRVAGAAVDRGHAVAFLRGPLRSLLMIERVALNVLTHLSGVATLTARYVQAISNTKARVYDTRKTLAGLRGLSKYAVVCGGGCSHRMGLHDAVLVKDNHIAHIPLARLADALSGMIAAARALVPPPSFIEIEVDTLDQLKRVLPCGPDVVLLDNMKLDQLRSAVSVRDKVAPGVALEASGGVNLETVLSIARTGVDRIAVGALTHSAAALDLGMDIR